MKIGFTCMTASGHLNPMTALARRFQARGHEVVFIGIPDAGPAARAAGLEFLPVCEEEYPPGSMARILGSVASLQGIEVLRRTIVDHVPGMLEATTRHLPGKLAGSGIEGLVIDTTCSFFEVVAMRMGIPYVHAWMILPSHPEGAAPPSTKGWRHEGTPEAIARNVEALGEYGAMLATVQPVAAAYAEREGLEVDWETPGSTISKLAVIAQTPAAFDYPGLPWPPHFHYTGPFHDDGGREPVAFAWSDLDGRPLVYASLGTIINAQPAIYRAIVAAMTKLPEVQVVLSAGKDADPAAFGPIPPNMIVVPVAPQVELLKRAELCITHAGLNTTLEALAQGVPLVAIPIGYDQPGVAARIAFHGAGEFIEPDQLDPDALAALVRKVLDDPSYRKNAQALRRAIAEANGLDAACELIEHAFAGALEPSAR